MNIKVITTYPVALDSNDHLYPHGTAHDNNANWRFNDNVYNLVPERPLNVLDLGCAGGAMIKNFVEDGISFELPDGSPSVVAVGLEGSDYCKKNKRFEWKYIPDNLFTCDISRPFEILMDSIPLKFHVITAWDVLEHMNNQERLDGVCRNIVNHLAPAGYFICSMPANEEGPAYGDPKWHHMHLTSDQWEHQFATYGLVPITPRYWHPCGWLRGEDDAHCYRKILRKI